MKKKEIKSSGTDYQFWVENYPNSTIWQATPAVRGGDTVYVQVSYNGATSTAFLSNQTTGQYTTVTFNSPYYDGTSADFVYEKMVDHANWGSTTFSNSMLTWQDSTGSGSGEVSAYNNVKRIQTTTELSTGTVQVQPSSVSNGSFTLTAK